MRWWDGRLTPALVTQVHSLLGCAFHLLNLFKVISITLLSTFLFFLRKIISVSRKGKNALLLLLKFVGGTNLLQHCFWNVGLNFWGHTWDVKHWQISQLRCASPLCTLCSLLCQNWALSGNYCVVLLCYCANIRGTSRQKNFLETN